VLATCSPNRKVNLPAARDAPTLFLNQDQISSRKDLFEELVLSFPHAKPRLLRAICLRFVIGVTNYNHLIVGLGKAYDIARV
jgi:hypothetical protein